VVYQDSRLLPWARLLDNVTLGLKPKQAKADAQRVLSEVGLGGRERSWPVTLSGGEAQRASLARALIRKPDLMLLDEPFGALDALTKITMHKLLRELCERYHPAVVLVTHDVSEALTLSDRIVVLGSGHVVHDERIDLAHPRDPHSSNFAGLRRQLLGKLGVEPHEDGQSGPSVS
jgi:sulfonate transport system ATP-binding protein